MKIPRKLSSSMTVNIILLFIATLAVFSTITSMIGRISVDKMMKAEYNSTTYHMAETAASILNVDHFKAYLAGQAQEEFLQKQNSLDVYCQKMNVSLLYVIEVDTSDYGSFTCIFDSVCNDVDDTNYVAWELGHEQKAASEEHREKYKKLYEEGSQYETVYRYKHGEGTGSHSHITVMVPIKNFEGQVAALLCIQRPIRELENAMMPYVITTTVSIIVLSVIFILVITYFIERKFLAPVKKVSKEAVRFANTKTKGESLARISNYTELANLADSVDLMEADMVSYMDNLASVTAEKERISAELNFARSIQEKSVPNIFPAFPNREDFNIYASMTPAREVGGDLYNFFLIDDDHLAMIIGDVSGKGVPAALFMMVTNIVLSNRTKMGGTPAEIMSYVNDDICDHNESGMFVTIWIGILELSTGTLIESNAGHENPVIIRKSGEIEVIKSRHGLVAGALSGFPYKVNLLKLEKGDKLFVYTDGVPEATDKDNKMFSMKRTTETLKIYIDGTPRDILEGIHKSVDEFVAGAPQFDDMTMMCLEYKGK